MGEIGRLEGAINICKHELLGKPDCLGSLESRRRRSGVWANHRPVFSNSGIGARFASANHRTLACGLMHVFHSGPSVWANTRLCDCDENT